MDNKNILSLIKEDGSIEEVELIMDFAFNETNAEYAIYTRNEIDGNGNTTLYISSVDRTDSTPRLRGVETEDEWSEIKGVLRELSKVEFSNNSNIEKLPLPSVIDNDIDDQPNKIKEQSESIKNTRENVKNVPLKLEIKIEEKLEENRLSDLMIEDVSIHKPEVTEKNEDFSSFVSSEVNRINDQEYNNISKLSDESSESIEDKIEELEKTSRMILNIKNQAKLAESVIDESNKTLQEVGGRLEAVEKEYQERQKLSNEYENKIIKAMEKQKKVLNQELSQSSQMINDADRIKKENNAKIISYQNRITKTEEKTNALNQKIAKQIKILESLGYSFNDYNNEEEQSFGKVA